ncbi:MAG: cation-transporting P-type ATPase [Smithellaceae bacterium]|jgi:magnesium-transporting ATPase (P-type)|nr:cation-transporting P-type ATPase [Syntrophaceae bacterium]MBP8608341.1 cation-transporting P-type ATPase [Syntrophaceae bacterium]MDX9816750.1 cation-transporting P-type ATPase [Smithellaceae bacterium]
MESIVCKHWHHCPSLEVTTLLNTNPDKGLSLFEAKHRLEKFGPNTVTAQKQKSALQRLLLQFHQPLIYILLAAAFVTLFLQEWVDSSVIFGVVIVNAIIGFVQESKAEKAIESLRQMMTTHTNVLRDGKWQEIDAVNLVVGDVVQLQSGDKVPADVRLLRCRDLQVDESALTGESVPVIKKEEILDPETILADRRNMAYAGTLVTYGQARAVVVATGDGTETGRISELITSAADLSTPLTKKIAAFSKLLLIAILFLAAATFAVGLWRGENAVDMFMAAVALAVGAIPEGLPAAVTITLAIGVNRMAKKKAIIRKLPAVETLGSTTVICSDKTGTLTENQMTVKKIFTANNMYDVEGNGYAPEGPLLYEGKRLGEVLSFPLQETLLAGLLCNDSRLIQEENLWRIEGDPTEGALITVAGKAGLTPDKAKADTPRLDEIPFESERQFMATLHDTKNDDENIIYVKGAVEKILDACSDNIYIEEGRAALNRDDLLSRVEQMASEGLRVLALARKITDKKHIEIDDCLSGLTFLGLQGMIDPPRTEAIAAVRSCHKAGIMVKMITGDHAITAKEIARQLNIGQEKEKSEAKPVTLTGKELEKLTDEELIAAAEETSVFARVAPEQKLRLVEALQARHNVVAMTGDGVNDAPALKQADIGIAMGITGTDVSKEAADMVLTDDNFASITRAVEEGRRIFDNLVKFITWTLPTNGGEGLVILAAIFAGVTLPILPVQILWVNMTTAILLGLMLAFEPGEPDVMDHPPREPNSPILTVILILRILGVSFLMLAAVFSIFVWQKQQGYPLAEARTVAVNLFVMIELAYLFNCRSLTKSMFKIGVFTNPWVLFGSTTMIILQLFYTYSPVMNRIFGSQPISGKDWLMIIAIALVVYTIIGLEKWLRLHVFKKTR